MKTTVTLFIFFTLFTVNTVAQDFTHTVLGLEDDPVAIADVYSVAFSPDGEVLASRGADGRIELWDVDTGTRKATLSRQSSLVHSIAFSPDGKTLASASTDSSGVSRIQLWDVDAATHKATLSRQSSLVHSIAFSPDGKTLAAGEDSRIQLWDVDAATRKATLEGHEGPVHSVAFSSDGKTLASAGEDSRIQLWDVDAATHKATLGIHGGAVYRIAFSPDGKTLASAGPKTRFHLEDSRIQLWDVDTATHKATLHGVTAHSVAFSPDGKTLAHGGTDGRIWLWDVEAATYKARLGRRGRYSSVGRVGSVAFSPDGKTLASAGADPRIHLWDVEAATYKATLGIHGGRVNSVAFSPDGKTLASAGEDPEIYLWDVEADTRKATLEGHGDGVYSIAFSPDGKTLASAGEDPEIYLWDVEAGTRKATLGEYWNRIYSVVFSPDGKILASGLETEGLDLWDIDTGTHKATLGHSRGGHRRGVYSVAFSPDGKILASGSDEGLDLWDVDAGTHKVRVERGTDIRRVVSIAFSPDGKTLARGDERGLRLWKFPTTHVNVTPYPVVPPAIGEQFTINLSVVDGEDVGGYQLTLEYDETSLRYVESVNGDYLPPGSFFVPPVVSENAVTLSATSLTGTSNGDGTLATVTFEVLEVKASPIALSDVILTDSASKPFSVLTYSSRVEPTLSSSPTVVDLTPSSVASPSIGERLAFDIRISDGQNVAGYQVSLEYDIKALKPVLASNALYLPDASPAKPLISEGVVTLGASSSTGVGNGNGVLATITFEVLTVQASTVHISGYLSTPNGLRSTPTFKGAELIVALLGDVNRDGSVDLQDLAIVGEHLGQKAPNSADVNEDGVVDAVDLGLVADAIKNNAAAPSLQPQVLELFTPEDVKLWLAQAQHLDLTDARFQRGILFLQQLLTALIPKEPALLANYPNPFNPETWIPYQLAKDADVVLTIYTVNGQLIRTLALGHQPAGTYQNRSRAAYWDGRNEVGESVASGVYFYTLRAGDFTATRRMLIRK